MTDSLLRVAVIDKKDWNSDFPGRPSFIHVEQLEGKLPRYLTSLGLTHQTSGLYLGRQGYMVSPSVTVLETHAEYHKEYHERGVPLMGRGKAGTDLRGAASKADPGDGVDSGQSERRGCRLETADETRLTQR